MRSSRRTTRTRRCGSRPAASSSSSPSICIWAKILGLSLIAPLCDLQPDARILVLTGYASIATAVQAVKEGADNYLAKPANVESILAALQTNASEVQADEALENPVVLSVDRLEWEHIQRVLAENNNNISATARALNMHRRTLQRKLAKKPVRQ
jgi:two-component system response regulator RegA